MLRSSTDNLSQASCSSSSASSGSHDASTSDLCPGGDPGSLSLAERVELNRSIVRHMLSSGPVSCSTERGEGEVPVEWGQARWTHTGSESSWDLSVPAASEHSECLLSQELALSVRHVRAKQLLDRARMKARCFPLKADHNLPLYRDPQEANARLRASPGIGRHGDHSSTDSALRHPGHAPSRVRFEDETEKEAESRYQRRAERAQGVLVTKPHLSAYINRKGAEPEVSHSGGLYWETPSMPCFTLHTEHIKETYIGAVTPGNTMPSAERGRGHVSTMRVKRANCVNRPLGILPPGIVRPMHTGAPLSLKLPPNPYAPEYVASPPSPPSPLAPEPTTIPQTTGHSSYPPSKPVAGSLGQGLQRGADLQPSNPVEAGNPLCSSSREPPAEPTAEKWWDVDGQARGPMRAGQTDDGADDRNSASRSRLSLRRIFSGLSGALQGPGRRRSGSLDQLSSRPGAAPDPMWPGPRKPAAPVECSPLRKTPSLQNLGMGSPFIQLRKTSSFQSLKSLLEKSDRSAAYSPGHQPAAPPNSCLSVQDVGTPCRLRSVGRVEEICTDGTVLLELHPAETGQYGFLIGRGQRNSGVYVQEMIDSSTEKLYSGLLSVGDEILEVNGQLVGRLCLDEVTNLLAQGGSTSVRILPHRKVPQS